MRKIRANFLFLLIFGFLAGACATPPTEEMNRAQDAVTRAENDVDAVTYAGNTLASAKDALARMRDEVDAKRYDAAKNLAAETVQLAEKAITDGRAGAARAREEAAKLVAGLAAPLDETAKAVDAAGQNGNLKIDHGALAGDMALARRTYDEAEQSLGAGNFYDTATKCESVRFILADINGKLTGAALAVSRKQ